MSGWLTLFGNVSNLDQRVERFKRIFSVDNVPPLNVEVKKHGASFVTFLWSWRNNPVSGIQDRASSIEDQVSSIKHRASNVFLDAYIVSNNDHILLLCGTVTGFGKFGNVTNNLQENAKKLLSFWSQNGEEVLKEINGSWSFVVYNKKENRLFAATDRFASRSVWLSQDKNTWIAGNFPSAIVVMRNGSTTYDPAGLWSLFMTSRHIPGKSIFKEVFSLTAGQEIELMLDSGYSILDWHERRYRPDHSITPKEWGYRFAHALKQSTNRIKKVTPEPYLFLSGGLDSRVAAAAFGNGLKTVTLCSSPNFESRMAGLVARNLKTDHRMIVRSPYWYLDTWNAAALITSGNYLITHTHFIVPAYKVSEKHPNASFLLGDLLENLNKHYFSIPKGASFSFTPDTLPYLLMNFIPSVSGIKYPASSIGHQASSIQYPASSIQYPASSIEHRASSIFHPDIRESLYNAWLEAVRDSAKLVMDVSEDDADRFDTYLRWVDVSVTYTYNMVTCLWPFAGERNIFFDNSIDDLSLQIPAQIRAKGVIHYWILKHLAAKTLLIPDANDFLPPFVPKSLKRTAKQIRPILGSLRRSIYNKAKKDNTTMPTAGSWPLFHQLYWRDKKYSNFIVALISDHNIYSASLISGQAIQELLNNIRSDEKNSIFCLNTLLSFGILNKLIPCTFIGK